MLETGIFCLKPRFLLKTGIFCLKPGFFVKAGIFCLKPGFFASNRDLLPGCVSIVRHQGLNVTN